MIIALRCLGERHVGFGDRADGGIQHAHSTSVFSSVSLTSAVLIASTEPCTSPLISTPNSLAAPVLMFSHHLLKRAALAGRRCQRPFAALRGIRRFRAPWLRRSTTISSSPAMRRAVEAEHFDRHRRRRFGDVLAVIVDQRAHLAPFAARDENIADAQCAATHQNGGHGAAAFFQLGFDNGAFGGTIGIGFEVENFRLQQNRFQQFVEAHFGLGGNFNRQNFAAHFLDLNIMLQQFLPHAVRIGGRQIAFVDRDDHRHSGGLGMA